MSHVLVDCGACDGTGVKLAGEGCGGACAECHGLGILSHPITKEEADKVLFSDLPPGWTKERAMALLSRMKTGTPVVLPEVVWSPYEGT